MTSLVTQALLIAAVFAAFYFVLVRPQQLRLKRHCEILAALRPGLRIATVGGVVGTIVRVDDSNLVTLAVSDEVVLTILRTSVDQVIAPAGACPAEAPAPEQKIVAI